MQSQAIFDICLNVGSVKNISKDWAPQFNFNISFEIIGIENFPCPYAIIQENQSKWKSSIDLNSYRSDSVRLGPLQEKQVLENCLWRASIPLSRIEDLQLLCLVEFEIQSQVLGSAKFNYSSCIGICSYLPIYSPGLGITISAKIQTQMLGLRPYKNLQQDRVSIIYKGIQNLFNEANRLTHKIKCLQNLKQENKTIETISTISPKKQQSQQSQQVSQYHLLYRQFEKIKSFKQSRIFKYALTKEHRNEVCSFINKLKSQFMNVLQLNWQKYLKYQTVQSLKKIDDLRIKFIQDFSYQVKNKILRNKLLQKSKVCPMAIGQLKSKIQGFELFQITQQSTELNKQMSPSSSLSFLGQSKQIMVLVHGLGANSLGMTYIERTIRYLYPHFDILNSTANQNLQENIDLQSMGRNLAIQVLQYIKKYDINQDFEISFIGHSLGGLVVRAALPYLHALKQSMNSFIAMATPHLGHLQHSNKIAKWGMIALNKLEKAKIIDNLLMRDNPDPRLTTIYNLSTQSCLSWFRSVIFYGSQEDGYVSNNSALAIDCGQGYFQGDHSIYQEMVKNINESSNNTKITKFNIRFEHEKHGYKPDIPQLLLGRSSHLAFPCHQSFINFMLLQNYKNFKEDNISLFEKSY